MARYLCEGLFVLLFIAVAGAAHYNDLDDEDLAEHRQLGIGRGTGTFGNRGVGGPDYAFGFRPFLPYGMGYGFRQFLPFGLGYSGAIYDGNQADELDEDPLDDLEDEDSERIAVPSRNLVGKPIDRYISRNNNASRDYGRKNPRVVVIERYPKRGLVPLRNLHSYQLQQGMGISRSFFRKS